MSSVTKLYNKKIPKNNSYKKDIISIQKLEDINFTESEKQNDNSSYILPPLNLSLKKKAYLEPTSVLTKFIHKKTTELIKQTDKNVYKLKKNPNNYYSYSNILSDSKKKQYIKDKIINNKSQQLNNSVKKISQKLLITDKNIINDNNNINVINNNNTIINQYNINNNKSIQLSQSNKSEYSFNNNISNQTNNSNINNKKEIFINEKELNDLSPIKSLPTSNKISNISTPTNEFNPSDNYIRENKLLSPKFRRICKYLPNINNSFLKTNNNNKLNFSSGYTYEIFNSDISSQSKIFKEQLILIEDDINQYKICTNKNNFFEVFKSMPLKTKIKYNQSIEEIIGILIILPKILLGNYYNLIYGIKEINIPQKENFKKSYIFDEKQNLIKNNNLLKELYNYLQKCFEFYLITSSKDNSYDLALNQKDYFKVLSYYEKIRDNLFYVINSFYNAEQNLNKDIKVINKIMNNYKRMNLIKDEDILEENKNLFDKKPEKKEIKTKVIERIREQFFFKKNKDLQKKMRINSSLGIDDKPIKSFNYLGEEIKKKRNQYKCIFDLKLFDKLINYFDKDTRIQIMSNKLTNEKKNNKIKKFKSKYNVVKINQ